MQDTCEQVPLISEKCPLACGKCNNVPIREDPQDLTADACKTVAGFDVVADTAPAKLNTNARISHSIVGPDISACVSECIKVGCKSLVHATNSKDQWKCHTYSGYVTEKKTKSRSNANIYSIKKLCVPTPTPVPTAATTPAPTPAPTPALIECTREDNPMICIEHGLTEMLCASNHEYRTDHCPLMCGTCNLPYGAEVPTAEPTAAPTAAPAKEEPCTTYTLTDNRKPKNVRGKYRVAQSDFGVTVDDCKLLCNAAPECAMFAYKETKQNCFLFSHVDGGKNNKLVPHKDWQIYTKVAGCNEENDNEGIEIPHRETPENLTGDDTPTPAPTPGGIMWQPEVTTDEPATAPAAPGSTPFGVSLGCANGWKMETKKAYGPKSYPASGYAVNSIIKTDDAVVDDDIACFMQCFSESTCAAAHYAMMTGTCTMYNDNMSDQSNWKIVGRAHSSGFIVCA